MPFVLTRLCSLTLESSLTLSGIYLLTRNKSEITLLLFLSEIMVMACFILFTILLSPLCVCFDQPSAIITGSSSSTAIAGSSYYLNSSLPSTWYNNDSINMTLTGDDGSRIRVVLSAGRRVNFVCGFYCNGSCISHMFSVVVDHGGTPGVVWSANREHPVSDNATLQLTRDGDLVLQDWDGTKVWSTNTQGGSVVGMNITEAGNFVLFNSEGTPVWQSFDYPTDALLVGQRLNEGQRLIAASSTSNWSHGIYYATITSAKGFATYTEAGDGPSLMYYRLMPSQSSSSSSLPTYAEFQRGQLLVKVGRSEAAFGRFPFSFPFENYVVYIRLDSDGHLRVYQHNDVSKLTVILDMVTQDYGECQHPLSCREYGVCREGLQCSCPTGIEGEQYFRLTQSQLPNQGCSRITPLSCQPSSLSQHHFVEIRNATYFNIIDPDSAIPNIKERERCKQVCMQNCSCNAAFFRYRNNASDGYCFLSSEVLTIRGGQRPNHSLKSTAYIKVQIPYEASSPLPESPGPPSRHQRNLAGLIIGSSAGAIVIIIAAVTVVSVVMMRKSNRDEGEDYNKQFAGTVPRFSYEELRIATKDFEERIGQGGFGTVFKGTLEDGTNVAVKRLDNMSKGLGEFLAEVKSFGSINHVNLVTMIGFCAEKSCRLLVYDYMCNGSLEKWIYQTEHQPCLSWKTRKKIIIDIAKGLAYLHEECRYRIVHLDIKPQNILLDENFNAKVSDFGLSKIIARDESQVQTTMRGTP